MTPKDNRVVVGVFEDRTMAERAVQQLKNAGFRDDQIGFVVRDRGADQGTVAPGSTAETGTTGEGAAVGAISGGILGGIIGAAAALLIPGIGPVVAGGILATTLAGAAVGAAAGGILGALTKLGVPEEEARYYESEFQAGRTIVTVQPDGRQQEALDILRRNGAYDASTRPAMAGYGASGTPGAAEDMSRTEQGEARRVPIREEELRATKQPVEAGEVRIGKEVVSEEKTINVPVQREQVFVEQRDVPARPADRPISEEGETIRVPVREEQVRVEKQPVETGEVVIGKQRVQDTEQYTDTVRREEPRIEREGDVDIRGSGAGGAEEYPTGRPD